MDSLWTLFLAVLAFVATVFALRTTVRFDVNEWLRDRRERREANLTAMCPHAMFLSDGQMPVGVRSTYISPFGTAAWQCQLCGHVTHDEQNVRDTYKYWAQHPEALLERAEEIRGTPITAMSLPRVPYSQKRGQNSPGRGVRGIPVGWALDA